MLAVIPYIVLFVSFDLNVNWIKSYLLSSLVKNPAAINLDSFLHIGHVTCQLEFLIYSILLE